VPVGGGDLGDAVATIVRPAFARLRDVLATEILPAARTQLDAVAAGIKMLPAETVITIEGHTDAVGSDAYNLALSRERALSVRDYLVGRHGIDPSHLKTAGYGEGRPIEGRDPFDGVNRRVEFRGS
jgi:outer membrane protein OmpA-like peptidoglycan-associated protein